MIKKTMTGFFLMMGIAVLLVADAGAMGGAAPVPDYSKIGERTNVISLAERVVLVDNFESGSLRSPREWWTFDLQRAAIAANAELTAGDAEIAAGVGNYSLLLAGPAKNWYAGGVGTYLAKPNQDLSKYKTFVLDIYGTGPESGTLKIELVDDDNNNWQVEQNPAKNYALLYDDKFAHEVRIDWQGWKRVSIPLEDFSDDNPLVGDDVWNPQQNNGSGGLLQVQFICLATSDRGKANFNVDNIMFAVE